MVKLIQNEHKTAEHNKVTSTIMEKGAKIGPKQKQKQTWAARGARPHRKLPRKGGICDTLKIVLSGKFRSKNRVSKKYPSLSNGRYLLTSLVFD